MFLLNKVVLSITGDWGNEVCWGLTSEKVKTYTFFYMYSYY